MLTTAVLVARGAEESPPPRIDVILWFDTEDYLLPASDDSAKRLAELLTERGIRATFKVVGEKARTLERGGRLDVIAALRHHAIAYHTDFHSVHPTPSEYLAECGLLDGVEDFVRRERAGASDVRRIFEVETLACYGQPGSSWAAQAVAGLKSIGVAPSGVPCYVDEGSHIGLNHQPFWFDGVLTVYDMGPNCTRMELFNPDAVEPATQQFVAIAERLRHGGGGAISIYYHPCEWVHRQFWDGVNFARGRNPPRSEWKAPSQRTPEETDAAFRRFGQYIDRLRSMPGVRFVTASDLPTIYPDLVRKDGATRDELDELAKRILQQDRGGVDFQVIGRKAFSVADQFEVLVSAVSGLNAGKEPRLRLAAPGLLGPDGPPPASKAEVQIAWPAFQAALADVQNSLETERRVPARVFIGAEAISPADFLYALASAYDRLRHAGASGSPEAVPLGRQIQLLPASHVAKDTPDLFGGWVIHPAGFRAPMILEVARLQTWTLKPAIRGD